MLLLKRLFNDPPTIGLLSMTNVHILLPIERIGPKFGASPGYRLDKLAKINSFNPRSSNTSFLGIQWKS